MAGQFLETVAELRVGFDGENAAHDAKGADLMSRAVLQGEQQGVGVVPAKFGEFVELIGARQTGERGGGGGAEFDWLLAELATEA